MTGPPFPAAPLGVEAPQRHAVAEEAALWALVVTGWRALLAPEQQEQLPLPEDAPQRLPLGQPVLARPKPPKHWKQFVCCFRNSLRL